MIENVSTNKKRLTYFLDETGEELSRKNQKKSGGHFSALTVHTLHTPDQIRKAAQESGSHGIWIASGGYMVAQFIKAVRPRYRNFGCLLVLNRISEATWVAAGGLFRHVAVTDRPDSFLPPDELGEVLGAKNRADLFIGGTVDRDSEVVVLFRGDFSTIVVPMDAFTTTGDKLQPDFSQLAVIDFGHTLKLGEYEASADGLLYEFDAKYRKRLNAHRKDNEKGFGPSLRRLRKQRGLKRGDFAPLSDKTVARIERGEVERPRGKTLSALAAKLRVQPEDIETY